IFGGDLERNEIASGTADVHFGIYNFHRSRPWLAKTDYLKRSRAATSETEKVCYQTWSKVSGYGEIVKRVINISFVVVLFLAFACNFAQAETGYEAWLRYAPLSDAERAKYAGFPSGTVLLGDSRVLHAAQGELTLGIKGMLGKQLAVDRGTPTQKSI